MPTLVATTVYPSCQHLFTHAIPVPTLVATTVCPMCQPPVLLPQLVRVVKCEYYPCVAARVVLGAGLKLTPGEGDCLCYS